MCTSISFNNGDFYFGRNMDIGYSFGERIIFTPRGYDFEMRTTDTLTGGYALLGIGTVVNDYPLYADAVNEKGLAMAGLNFPGFAHYMPVIEDKFNITPFEFIPYILKTCASVSEAKNLLQNVSLVDIAFSPQIPLAPLHWMIADKEESIVVEQTKDGLIVHHNPVGVMTNNPTFDWHLMNLNNYMNCSAYDPEDRFGNDISLMPLGHGIGGLGLPGDTLTTSRFVRAAFIKSNSVCEPTESANLSQFFRILDGVGVAKGAAITHDGTPDYTTYVSCINATKGIYYYKTYENTQISGVDMHKENLDGTHLVTYQLITTQQLHMMN